MTRKHFRLIAQALRNTRTKKQLIDELCIIFKKSNKLFDKDRFIDACLR